ncbi:thermonuclease family protein [Methylobacillus arboreus]|uniref:thermonuclease family protein n=1 Tax=Methylobacillus arboreus TaxID=755170 RepID=UPI001E2FE90C|nr:thermonuclease family protein [Methylobacillus arboreus]MCB5191848.1 thermonuclease family protein [Methylobacillus arboreus]
MTTSTSYFRYPSFYCLLAIALLNLGLTLNANADTITGKVIHIADGDSLTIMANNTQHKVRLLGIDAPERNQAYGKQARVALNRAINGKNVTVDWNKRDDYGRIVGKVVYNGQDINLQQIQKGMAWHYKYYEREQEPEDRSRYAQAEYQAKRDKQGLWQDASPVPPWQYRRTKR